MIFENHGVIFFSICWQNCISILHRDRAKERRDGGVGTADATPGTEEPSSNDTETDVKRQIAARAAAAAAASGNSGAAGYRAVAPDIKSSFDAQERRKRMIQVQYVYTQTFSLSKVPNANLTNISCL